MCQVFIGEEGIALREGGTLVSGLEDLEVVEDVWYCLVLFELSSFIPIPHHCLHSAQSEAS
jgi:hypothetical protein